MAHASLTAPQYGAAAPHNTLRGETNPAVGHQAKCSDRFRQQSINLRQI
jgi:hypothetical protein